MCAGSQERVAGARLTGPFRGLLRTCSGAGKSLPPGRVLLGCRRKEKGVGVSGCQARASVTPGKRRRRAYGGFPGDSLVRELTCRSRRCGIAGEKLGFPASWSKKQHIEAYYNPTEFSNDFKEGPR